ncbi:MAG: class I SAM-dependent methyltransferase [Coxiellaceae bacterium]|nr:class I SAM-dependent methyltransferase [Coxiellaceae bacterium]
MAFKDLFSGHASDYSRYRPTYPAALFAYLAELAPNHQAVWDCGTGNGQGALGLAQQFDQVYATDASAEQIEQAKPTNNIAYRVATAEDSGLEGGSVSTVTVFQALHWFDLDKFYTEVKRVLQPNGVIAIVGYNTAVTGNEAVDEVYHDFCFDYLWQKKCWAMKRKGLNDDYKNIDFPFEEITAKQFYIEMQWSYYDYLNYLNTWSAVKNHIKQYADNPVDSFVIPKISELWVEKDKPQTIRFPLILRLGWNA